MAKRPSFQFYPADWQGNSNLRRCTHEEKGIWLDVLCILHDQEEYGAARWPLKEIAGAVGVPVSKLKALVTKGILKGADAGDVCDPYIFTPTGAGRKKGAPVELLCAQYGPIWYSSRMVVDEYKKKVRANNESSPNSAPIPPIGASLKVTPNPAPLRACASSPSPSTSTNLEGGDNSKSSAPPASSQTAPPVNQNSETKPTAGEVCKQLMALQVGAVNPGHPLLTMLLEAGATIEEFTGAAKSAVANGKGKFAYVLNTVKGQREDAKAAASTIAVGSIKREKPWFITASGIEAKAKELNITINPKDEAFPQLQVKVFRACGITQEILRKANQDFGAKA